MFDLLKLAFNINIPEPKVGTILIDRIWGDYNKIEVVKISSSRKEILYKFLIVKGDKALGECTWKYLVTDTYKILE